MARVLSSLHQLARFLSSKGYPIKWEVTPKGKKISIAQGLDTGVSCSC